MQTLAGQATKQRGLCLLMLIIAFHSAAVQSATARIAVAANFSATAQALAAEFSARSGHTIELATGATGLLYAQITRGAPFDVFMAADRSRPARLADEGYADSDSLFIYAHGRLAYWVRNKYPVPPLVELLRTEGSIIALANPTLAPYGVAAKALINVKGGHKPVSKLVFGENVSSAFSLVASGNAQAGLVAYAQLLQYEIAPREYLLIPASDHPPIVQATIITRHGSNNAAARAFHRYVSSDAGRLMIETAGYGLPPKANDYE